MKTMNITPVTNHREREKGVIVYPVYSRRSAGLSIGINLFPAKKNCQFDCPYCEVFPFSGKAEFSLEQMEEDLRCAIINAKERNIPIKDICFSGNGEPTISPAFKDAFKLAEKIHSQEAGLMKIASTKIVIITNGAGLLQNDIFSFLKDAAANSSVDIWLKADAGTSDWYQKINRCALQYEKLIEKIKEFAGCAPVTIQTMLCAVNGEAPSEAEAAAWENLVCELAANGRASVRKIQLYGKARPSPEDPLASILPEEYLNKRAALLCEAFIKENILTPVEVYI